MFYSVKVGRMPGVYTSWEECKKQVDGFKGAVFKKFKSSMLAEHFCKVITEEENCNCNDDNLTFIYTDGSCISNGTYNAKAGIGIYFGEGDPRNISQSLEDNCKHTNNTAELTAMKVLGKYLIKMLEDKTCKSNFCIVSDSVYAIRCVGEYGEKFENSNWSKEIPNKELVKETYQLFKDYSHRIKFKYVKAHTGAEDKHSIGNDAADKLARDSVIQS